MTNRTLTNDFKTALALPEVLPFLIVKIGTADGDINVWSGIGNLIFDPGTGNEIFIGVGTFGGMSAPQETKELKANGVNLSLSGVPASMISLALQSMRQGKDGRIWMGLYNVSTGVLIEDPIDIFSGLTDIVAIEENVDASQIIVGLESRLVNLKKKHDRRYTPEDQKRTFPNDLGFDQVASLQEKEILFGKSR